MALKEVGDRRLLGAAPPRGLSLSLSAMASVHTGLLGLALAVGGHGRGEGSRAGSVGSGWGHAYAISVTMKWCCISIMQHHNILILILYNISINAMVEMCNIEVCWEV